MKKLYALILTLSCLSMAVFSQSNAPLTSAPFRHVAVGGSVALPIKSVATSGPVNAITLKLVFDHTVLDFNSGNVIPNESVLGASGFSSISVSGDTLLFGWFGPAVTFNPTNPVTIFTINAIYLGGETDLIFLDDGISCEYTNSLGIPYNDSPTATYYRNGSVSDNSAPQLFLPNLSNICPGDNIDVPITVDGFRWIYGLNFAVNFNADELIFLGVDLDPVFASAFTPVYPFGGGIEQFYFTWINGAMIDFELPNDYVIATLHFTAVSGTPGLNFYDNGGTCEFYDFNANSQIDTPQASFYHDGSVSIYPVNDLSFNIENVTCFGGSNGSAEVNGSGDSPFQYTWSNGGDQSTITGLIAGTYTVIVEDVHGCTIDGSVTITQPESYSLNLTSQPVSCYGLSDGNILLDILGTGGVAPYTYAWSNTATTEDLLGVIAGNYSVTVLDDNGCSPIGGGSAPAVITFADLSGQADYHTLMVSNVTIGGNTLPVGNYRVGVFFDQAGQPSCGGFNVDDDPWDGISYPLGFAAWGKTTSADDGFAEGETFTWIVYDIDNDLLYSGTPTYFIGSNEFTSGESYFVDELALTPYVSGGNEGVYFASVLQPDPLVTQLFPSVSVSGYSITCHGGNDGSVLATTTGGNYPPYNYLWSNGQTGTGPAHSITGLVADNYSVTVIDAKGCKVIKNVDLTEPPQLPAVSVLGVPSEVCSGFNANLSFDLTYGQAPFTFVYNDENGDPQTLTNQVDGGTFTITLPVAAGSYTYKWVSITDAYNCHTNLNTSLTITVNPLPTVSGTGPAQVCLGETADIEFALTGTSPWQISMTESIDGSPVGSWNPTAMISPYTFSTIPGLGANKYSVASITDGKGCVTTNAGSVTVMGRPHPVVDLGVDTVICAGTSFLLDAGAGPTYLWSDNSSIQTLLVDASGNYAVTVTNVYNCITIDDINVIEALPLPLSADFETGIPANWSQTTAGAGWLGGDEISLWSDFFPVYANHANFIASNDDQAGPDNDASADCIHLPVLDLSPYAQSVLTFDAFFPTYNFDYDATGVVLINSGGNLISYNVSLNDEWQNGIVVSIPYSSCNTQISFCYHDNGNWASGFGIDNVNVTGISDVSVEVSSVASICPGEYTPSVTIHNLSDVPVSMIPVNYTAGTNSGSGIYTDIIPVGGSVNYVFGSGFPITAGESFTLTVASTWTGDLNAANNSNSEVINGFVPMGSAGSDDVICFGEIAHLNAIDGVTYNWSTGATTASIEINPILTTTYTVTITDVNGCVSSDDAVVFVNPLPVVSAGLNQTICFGQSAVLTATPGLTYLWSTTETTQSITVSPVLPTNVYSVVGTDVNGCSNSSEVTVFVLPLPNAQISGLSEICQGEITALTASGGISYLWSTGASGPSINVNSSGIYTVTVTGANFCTKAVSHSLLVKPLPQVVGGPTQTICFGETATITVSGNAQSYSWGIYGSGVSVTVTPAVTTTYNVVGTLNGCTNTSSVQVIVNPLPIPGITGDDAVCFGESAILTATGGDSYVWSNGVSAESITVNQGGTYFVTVTDVNGCKASTSFLFTVYSLPLANAGDNQTICFGQEATLTATGGISYLWNVAGGNTPTIIVTPGLGQSDYYVTVTDGNQCSVVDMVSVFVNPLPTVIISGNLEICSGGQTLLTASGADNYLWSNGATTASITVSPLINTSYSVTGTLQGTGCQNSASSQVVVNSLPAFSGINQSNISCFGFNDGSINLTIGGGNPPYGFNWSNSASTEDVIGLMPGIYSVVVTDSKNCQNSESFTITEPTALTSFIQLSSAVTCYGFTNGGIEVIASGGTAPYTYNWSNSVSTNTNYGIGAGNYGVVVTDANGCESSSSTVMTEPDDIISSLIPTHVNCLGQSTGSINLSVSGGTPGYTYIWTPGNYSVQDPSGLAAGFYSVTITDLKGCFEYGSVEITQPASAVSGNVIVTTDNFYNGYDVSCAGSSDGGLSVNANGGTPGYTYLWSNGQTNISFSVGSGTYKVTVTDALGCTFVSNTVTLTAPSSFSSSRTIVRPCFGTNEGSITFNVSGGVLPYTYLWSNGTTTANNTGIPSGSHTVTVTDANSCTYIQTYNIEPWPQVFANVSISNALDCSYSADGELSVIASAGTPPYVSYLWSNGGTANSITGLVGGIYSVTVIDNKGCKASDSETLVSPNPIVISIAGQSNYNGYSVSCFGSENGWLNVDVTGGTGSYSYAWSNGSNTNGISGEGFGNYSVIVTDQNFCTSTFNVTLTQPNLVSGTIELVQPISCNGDFDGVIQAVPTGGVAPYTYVWSGGLGTNQSVSGLGIGNYSLFIKDANGCPSPGPGVFVGPYALTQPGVLTLTTQISNFNGFGVGCNGGSNGWGQVNVSGGTAPFSYFWNFGPGTNNPIGLSAGVYTVTVVDDHNCVAVTSFEITQPTPLTLSATLSDYNGVNVTCNGAADGTISLLVGGGVPNYSYSWSNGGITSFITGLTAGIYSVVVTDANGCIINGNSELIEPQVFTIASIDAVLKSTGYNITCSGGNDGAANLTVGSGYMPYTYLWDNGSVDEDPMNLNAGTHYVTVTDDNGCVAVGSVVMTEPDPVSGNFIVGNVICFGQNNGSIELTPFGGVGPYSVVWSNQEVTFAINNLVAGTYVATITDSQSCTGTVSIEVTQPDVLALQTIVNNVSCFGYGDGSIDLTVLGGTAPFEFFWSNTTTNEDADNLIPGEYAVFVVDAHNCIIASDILYITEPVSFTADAYLISNVSCYGGSNGSVGVSVVGGNGISGYLWSIGATTSVADGLITGSYYVEVTDQNGCVALSDIQAVYEPNELVASGVVTDYNGYGISCFGANDGEIISTVSGGTLPYSYNWSNGATTINVSNLSPGSYFLTVSDAQNCSDIVSFEVTEPSEMLVNYSLSSLICSGVADVDLSVSGGSAPYSYLWDNGQTVEDANGIITGMHWVAVTDSRGCTQTFQIENTFPGPFTVVTEKSDVSCFGMNDGSISTTIEGGLAPYNYMWFPNNEITSSVSNLDGGEYYVFVEDFNGCWDFAFVTILEPGTAFDATISSTNSGCFGENEGTITLSAFGGYGNYSYLWNDGITTPNRTNLADGFYSVTITDNSGQSDIGGNCVIVRSATIVSPAQSVNVYFNYSPITCYGYSTTVTVTADGGTGPYAGTGDFIVQSGLFTVTVSDANGCSTVGSVDISQPSVVEVTALAGPISCAGQLSAVEVSATGGTPDYTGTGIINLSAGVHTINVTDANGCIGSTQISISEPSQLVAYSVAGQILCNGQTTFVTVTAAGGSLPYTGEGNYSVSAGAYSFTVTDANGCESVTSGNVTEPDLFVASSTYTTIACNGDNSVITVSVIGGTLPYVGDGNYTVAAGAYSYTVTDANGCEAVTSGNITEPELLVASSTYTTIACNGDNSVITVSAIGGTSPYVGDGNFTVSAGAYSYTVTDANGCESVASGFVTEPDLFAASSTYTTIACNGDNSVITVSAVGGTLPYSGVGNFTESAGAYSYTVTDANGCESITSVSISEPELFVASSTYTTIACNGDNSVVTVSAIGGTLPYVGDGNFTVGAGAYSYIVTDANGCSSVTSGNISQPSLLQANAVYDAVVCEGQTNMVEISGIGGTPNYSGTGNFPTGAGTHLFTITDANNCSASTSVVITSVPVLGLSISSTPATCSGWNNGTANVNVTGGSGNYLIEWSTGENTATITNLSSGDYSVTVTDLTVTTCGSATDVVTVGTGMVVDLTGIATPVTCNGGSDGSVHLTVAGGIAPLTYFWSNGNTNMNLIGMVAGNYSVTVTDSNGCFDYESFEITQPLVLSIVETVDNVSCFGAGDGSIFVQAEGGNGGYTYLWTSMFPWSYTNTGLNHTVLLPSTLSTTGAITSLQPGDVIGVFYTDNYGSQQCSGYAIWTGNMENIAAWGAYWANPNVGFDYMEPFSWKIWRASTGIIYNAVASYGMMPNGGNWLPNGLSQINAFYTSPDVSSTVVNSQTISNLEPGEYTILLVDSKGCTATETYNITQPEVLASSLTYVDVNCFGGSNGSVNLSVTGGTMLYNYLWSNGATTQDLNNIPAGSYSVTITDANQCVAYNSVVVTQPTQLIVNNIFSNVTCWGNGNGWIDVSVSGGVGPYMYVWSTGAITQDINSLVPGTYTVTVTDSHGCSATNTVVITQPNTIAIGTSVAPISCYGGTTNIIISSVNGGTQPYHYHWSTGATTMNLSSIPAGTYTVTVEDYNGCTNTNTRTVNQPSLIVPVISVVNPLSCYGDADGALHVSVTGGTLPYQSYIWNDDNGTNGLDVTGLIAGNYTVIVTDNKNCQISASYLLAQPSLLVSQGASINVNCHGENTGSIDLSVAGGVMPYTYLWNTGQTTQDLQNIPAGAYNVTVTDYNLCTSYSSFIITEPVQALGLSIQTSNVLCNGGNSGSAILSVVGGTLPYSIDWFGMNPQALYAGNYNVVVTDGNGCSVSHNFQITQPDILSITGVVSPLTCNGNQTGAIDVTVTGGTVPFYYNWSNGSFNSDLMGIAAGMYSLTVTDINFCKAFASFNVNQPAAVQAVTQVSDYSGFGTSAFGASDGYINLSSVTGGVAPYSFQWSNGAVTQNISGLEAGSYSVVISDATDCIIDLAFEITQPPMPLLSAVGSFTGVNCYGDCNGSALVVATGGFTPYTYLWSNGSTASSLSDLCAGTYTVSVYDSSVAPPSQFSWNFTYTGVNHSLLIPEEVVLVNNTPILIGDIIGVFYTKNDGTLGCGGYMVYNGYFDALAAWGDDTSTPIKDGFSANETFIWKVWRTVAGHEVDMTPNYDLFSGFFPNAGNFVVNGMSGLISLTGTSGNSGTQVVVNITVTSPSILAATGTSINPSCNGGSNGSINLSVTGGTAPYTFAWSNGSLTEDLNNIVAGNYSVIVTDAHGCTTSASFEITQPNVLVASALGTNPSCFSYTNGSVNLTVTGGTLPYTFAWSNGASTEDINNLLAGVYSVVVTDALGCSSQLSVTVTQPATIAITTQVAPISCNGGTTNIFITNLIGGTPPYSYTWSNGSQSQNLTGVFAGIYTVTVSDQNGCNYSSTRIINQPALLVPTINLVSPISCYGNEDGVLHVSAIGGTPAYSFIWNDDFNTTGTDVTGLSAGNYTVTVTDIKGCTSIASMEISAPDQLSVDLIGYDVSCYGLADGYLSASVYGGTMPYSYLWSNTETNFEITNLVAGMYNVSINDAHGCTAFANMEIMQPTELMAGVTTSNVVCFGQDNGTAQLNISGGVLPYDINWNGANANALIAGNYIVEITDYNGCYVSVPYSITQPDPLTVDGTVTDALCHGQASGSIEYLVTGGTAPYYYNTLPGGLTSQIADGLAAGSYYVTVTDVNFCNVSGYFTVNQPEQLTAISTISNYNGYSVSAYGASDGIITITSVLGGVIPYSFNWSTGESTPEISGLVAGTYECIISDGNQCAITLAFELTQPPMPALAISLTGANVSCSGVCNGLADLTITGGLTPYSIHWSNGETTQDLANLCAGIYTVTVADASAGPVGVFDWTYTNTGSTHIYLVPELGVTVNGLPIEIGDYVGVFYTNNDGSVSCGGYLEYAGWTDAIAAWGDDSTTPLKDGFGAGETIIWKVFKTSTGQEVDMNPVYDPSIGLINTFVSQGISGLISLTGNTSATGNYLVTSVEITQPSGLTANANFSPVLCSGGSTYVEITANGGTAPFTGVGTFMLSAGSYSYVVTDANGCEAVVNFVITEPDVLSAQTIFDPILCNGQTTDITVNATGGTAPYSGTGTFSVFAGSYTYSVVDANGCQTSVSVVVDEPTLLDATLTYDPILCNGQQTVVMISATGGTAPYTGIGSYSVYAGDHMFNVTDANGCTVSVQAIIGQPEVLFVNVFYNPIVCNGSQTTIEVTATGGVMPYVGEGLFVVGAGNYNYSVTDANGCLASIDVVVNQPDALILDVSYQPIACNGGTTEVSVSANGGLAPYYGTGMLTVSAGEFFYYVIDANNCQVAGSVIISEPAALAVNYDFSPILCNGATSTVNVYATGGTLPYAGAGQFTASAGTFNYSVVDANGCTVAGSFEISEPTAFTASASYQPIMCNGGTTAVTVTGFGGVEPYTGTGTFYVGAGPFYYNVSDANGCTYLVDGYISETAAMDVTVDYLPISCNGGTTEVTVSANGGLTPYMGTGTFTASAGEFFYYVIDANYCQVAGSVFITEPAALAVSYDFSPILCNGGTSLVNVYATGGTLPYSGAGQFTVSAGTFNYSVVDANGCTVAGLFEIAEPTVFTASASYQPIMCNGGTTAVTVTGFGGVEPYSGVGIFYVGAGSFLYSVSDANGCTYLVDGYISEPAAMDVAVDYLPIVCNGGTTEVTISANGGLAPYYGTGTFTASAGEFFYYVVDANYCMVSGSVVISQPDVLAVSYDFSPILCNGGTSIVNVYATGGTLPYTGAGQFTASAGTFNYSVVDANGCSVAGSFEIAEPTVFTASASYQPIMCNGGTTAVTVTGFGGVEPYTGTGTFYVGAGQFYYNVSDANGCTYLVDGYISEPVAFAVDATSTEILCAGGISTVVVSAIGGVEPYSGTGIFYEYAGNYNYTVTDALGCSSSVNVMINEPAQFVGTFTFAPILCNGGSTTIYVDGIGGTAPYSGTGAYVVGAGSYSYNLTDANGCSYVVDVVVNEPVVFDVNATFDPILCFGNTTNVTVAATGGVLPYSGTGIFTVNAGSYTFDVVDGNGCWTSVNVSVSQPDILTVSTDLVAALCAGNPSYVTVSATGGVEPYQGTGLFTVNDGYFFYNVVDANGCSVSGYEFILLPTPIEVVVNTVNVNCNGSATGSVSLDIYGGAAPYVIDWNGINPSAFSAGVYNIMVTDANACQLGVSFEITQPEELTVSVDVINAACNGLNGSAFATISGGVAPYSVNWFGVNPMAIPAGNYSVEVTDANGCVTTANFVITQSGALNVSVSTTNVTCEGLQNGTASLTITGGTPSYSVNWNGVNPLALAAGSYSVEVTDANGCIASAGFVINEPVAPELSFAVTNIVTCAGASTGAINMTISGSYTSILWSNGATTEDLVNIPAGTYTVVVYYGNGCEVFGQAIVTQPAPFTINVAPYFVNTLNVGLIAIVSGGVAPYTYTWSNGIHFPSIRKLIVGATYCVTVTDANGCIATACGTYNPNTIASNSGFGNVGKSDIKVPLHSIVNESPNTEVTEGEENLNPETNGWNNAITEQDVNIYPNPVRDGRFYVDLTSLSFNTLRIEILDSYGRVVMNREVSDNFETNLTMETIGLKAGNYFVRFVTDQNVVINKPVILVD